MIRQVRNGARGRGWDGMGWDGMRPDGGQRYNPSRSVGQPVESARVREAQAMAIPFDKPRAHRSPSGGETEVAGDATYTYGPSDPQGLSCRPPPMRICSKPLPLAASSSHPRSC